MYALNQPSGGTSYSGISLSGQRFGVQGQRALDWGFGGASGIIPASESRAKDLSPATETAPASDIRASETARSRE